MKTFALPKSSLLTKPQQYNKVYASGKRLRGKGFNLIFRPNHQLTDRLGISISGVRLAVRRNRLKRIIKDFYRHNRSFPSQIVNGSNECQKVDMVLATRKNFPPVNLRELRKLLIPFIAKSSSPSALSK